MLQFLRSIIRSLPTLAISLIIAVAVWLSAVSQADPNEIHSLAQPIAIEVIGQDPGLVMLPVDPGEVTLMLNAPQSIWQRLNTRPNLVQAVVDLSGLKAGNHRLSVQIQVNEKPVRVVSITPDSIMISLEELVSISKAIDLVPSGEPAIGYQVGIPSSDVETVFVSGPQSRVESVASVRAEWDVAGYRENKTLIADLSAVDNNGDPVNGITLLPDKVTINQPVLQKGGYRNVVVKVITQGNIASGYRLTNISVYPPTVTVFSNDPGVVEALPGVIETEPINLNNATGDITRNAAIQLPDGVTLVGDEKVLVFLAISTIESSITLDNIPLTAENLADEFTASYSPDAVDVILSGPLPLLDGIRMSDIRVTVDLAGLEPGIHQIVPVVSLTISDIRVESILPGTIQVTISRK